MAIQPAKDERLELADGDLVRAVLGGNRSGYAELYDRYAPVIRAICEAQTHDLACAQDLSQEVFMKAYRKLRALRDPERFGPWVVGIARNQCRDWHRHCARDPHRYTDQLPERPCESSNGQDQDAKAVLTAMRLLPERERLALQAFYLQGESAGAVRTLLGLSTAGTYRLLERARQQLATLLRWSKEDEP